MSKIRTALEGMGRYLNRPISTAALDAYEAALRGVDADAVVDATVAWMRAHSPSSTLPSPQELRGFAREQTARQTAGNPRDTTQPWAMLERAANKPYQRAIARMMRAALAGGPEIAAKLYRAFAAEHGETVPWERMAQDAEAEAASRRRGRAA